MRRALLTCLVGAAVLAGVWLPRAQAKSQTLAVVAAESVYGDIAEQIGGADVAVTSILDDPNADPHLYEPGTSNALAVAKAKVVIQNGLGYDAFMSRLESALTEQPPERDHDLRRTRHQGQRTPIPTSGTTYPALSQIAAAIAGRPRAGRPHERRALQARPREIRGEPCPTPQRGRRAQEVVCRRARCVHRTGSGLSADRCGHPESAPDSFTRAIEDGSEPSPSAVAQMTELDERPQDQGAPL